MFKATKEQIAEWKAKYGDVFCIKIEDKACCYLKKPDRKILGYAGQASQANPLKFNEVILYQCWIDGDEEIKTNDDLFLAAAPKVLLLNEVYKSDLEKL